MTHEINVAVLAPRGAKDAPRTRVLGYFQLELSKFSGTVGSVALI